VNVPYTATTLTFVFTTNNLVAQMEYRWFPNYNPGGGLPAATYTCDICTGGNTATNCNTSVGPGTSPSPVAGYPCSLLARTYTFSGLVTGANSLSVQLFDRLQLPAPNVTSYSFAISKNPPPIIGDPQIVGLQGQDFQVHGIPDEIFNLVTYPNLQVNARFVYLSSAECHDNFTACFAHPGTYIGEEGIRVGTDRVHVKAGSFKKGLTVSINGQRVNERENKLKLGSVQLVSHRRVVVNTPVMSLTVSNSDKFLNQEVQLHDNKLLSIGKSRRVLSDNEQFHTEVPLHGLQGQTWRNVEYPSGLDYEGSINDYHVVDGNLYGTDFMFNQFKQ